MLVPRSGYHGDVAGPVNMHPAYFLVPRGRVMQVKKEAGAAGKKSQIAVLARSACQRDHIKFGVRA